MGASELGSFLLTSVAISDSLRCSQARVFQILFDFCVVFKHAWEQRKLGDVVDVRSGKDYKHLQEGSIPVYGTGGYMLSVSEALSYSEDAIGIGRKGTIDKPYILKAPFWTVDTLFYAVPKEKYDLNFVFDIFQNIDWKKKDESTGVPSLSKTAINEIDTLAPKEPEQKVIGSYFTVIDNLITLHQRKPLHWRLKHKCWMIFKGRICFAIIIRNGSSFIRKVLSAKSRWRNTK